MWIGRPYLACCVWGEDGTLATALNSVSLMEGWPKKNSLFLNRYQAPGCTYWYCSLFKGNHPVILFPQLLGAVLLSAVGGLLFLELPWNQHYFLASQWQPSWKFWLWPVLTIWTISVSVLPNSQEDPKSRSRIVCTYANFVNVLLLHLFLWAYP